MRRSTSDNGREPAAAERSDDLVAVIDLGSNSVRLVVYDRLSRAPFPRFDEKSRCRLGASLDEDGNLGEEAMECTLRALERFTAIARAMRVGSIELLATESLRNATNGAAFRERIESVSGLSVSVLSGDDEARLAARAVIAGYYLPEGLVGDLGGGSLEIAEVRNGGVGDGRVSMPIGALRITERLADDSPAETRRYVDDVLRSALPGVVPGVDLYLLGGGWRALAKVHLANHDRKVPIIHGLVLETGKLRTLAKSLSRMTGDELREVGGVPKRRIATTAAAALVLDRVLKHLEPGRVLFSALGVREGWMYEQLADDDRGEDPLIAGCRHLEAATARVTGFAAALERWTNELFVGESAAQRRLRIAATLLSDLAWREASDLQGRYAWERILRYPLIGLTHAERVFVAASVYSRYTGKRARFDELALLDDEDVTRAHVLGAAMLLGHRFSGSVPDILDQARIRVDEASVSLVLDDSTRVPDSKAVQKRLSRLAKALDRDYGDVVVAR